MTEIVIGTTPTFTFKFNIVDPSDLIEAIFTIKKGSEFSIRKELETATVGEDTLSWKFTQEETIGLGLGYFKAQLTWLTADGTRGVSPETQLQVINQHIPEVIS